MKEFDTIDEMLDYIVEEHHLNYGDKDFVCAFDKEDIVIDDRIIYDERCGWNTQHVCVKRYFDRDYMKMYGVPQCIGQCDLKERMVNKYV